MIRGLFMDARLEKLVYRATEPFDSGTIDVGSGGLASATGVAPVAP